MGIIKMRGVNLVVLVGTLGANPESKSFPNGGSLCNFSIATSEKWQSKQTGEWIEQTEWHRVSAWGKTVDIIEKLLTKGSHVAIEGKLTHRSYDDKDGNKRYISEVVANELVLLRK